MNELVKLKKRIDVQKWLDKHDVEGYRINDDCTVDVDTNVQLSDMGLVRIPVKFNIINGYFSVKNNQLTTTEGFPKKCDVSIFCQNNAVVLERPKVFEGVFDNGVMKSSHSFSKS